MSRDKAGSVANAPDRQIAFRAPDIVHGGLKEIIGRLERISYVTPETVREIMERLHGTAQSKTPGTAPGAENEKIPDD